MSMIGKDRQEYLVFQQRRFSAKEKRTSTVFQGPESVLGCVDNNWVHFARFKTARFLLLASRFRFAPLALFRPQIV